MLFFIFLIQSVFSDYIVHINSLENIQHNYKKLSDIHILVKDEHFDYFNNHYDVLYIEKNKKIKPHFYQCEKPWGIDRINQEDLPLDNDFTFNQTNSSNVDIYVLDSGIDINHEEFSHKQPIVLQTFGDNNDNDCNGHGTHIAGIIGGRNTGVSPNANIFSVKITHDCDGHAWVSDMVSAINYVKQRMINNRKSIINLSFSSSYSVNSALNVFMINGGFVSLSAGNDDVDISDSFDYSNFNLNRGLIVGAIDRNDNLASYSNYGSNVYIYAPGTNILSSYIFSNDSCASLSGTSMAAPYVSVISAIYWNDKNINSYDLTKNIINNSMKNKIITNYTIHNNLIFLSSDYNHYKDNDDIETIFVTVTIILIVACFAFCFLCKSDPLNNFNIPRRIHHNNQIRRLYPNPRPIIELSISREGLEKGEENFEIKSRAHAIQNLKEEGKLDKNNNNLSLENIYDIDNYINNDTPISFEIKIENDNLNINQEGI